MRRPPLLTPAEHEAMLDMAEDHLRRAPMTGEMRRWFRTLPASTLARIGRSPDEPIGHVPGRD